MGRREGRILRAPGLLGGARLVSVGGADGSRMPKREFAGRRVGLGLVAWERALDRALYPESFDVDGRI